MRTIDVHTGFEQGACPNSQNWSADTAVKDTGEKPAGTGPPDGGVAAAVVVVPAVVVVVDEDDDVVVGTVVVVDGRTFVVPVFFVTAG